MIKFQKPCDWKNIYLYFLKCECLCVKVESIGVAKIILSFTAATIEIYAWSEREDSLSLS